MAIINSNLSACGLVEKYIGTAYDNVKNVSDNMSSVEALLEIIESGEIEELLAISDSLVFLAALINYKGDWVATTSYVIGDSVQHLGRFYIADQDNLSVTPGIDVDEWSILSGMTGMTSSLIHGIGSGYADQVIISQGFATPGDGGEGSWFWDASFDKSKATLGTSMDPTVAFTLADQGTGTGTGCWVRSYSGPTNVLWFGADPTHTIDSSAAINAAIETGMKVLTTQNGVSTPTVRIPQGEYLCNILVDQAMGYCLRGDGSGATILTPMDPVQAVITLKKQNAYTTWNYAQVIEELTVMTVGETKVGLGISAGAATENAPFEEDDQVAHNYTFKNVRVSGFKYGFYFKFGSIGNSFYNCGINKNYYGMYFKECQATLPLTCNMHFGNKYIHDCEFHSNSIAVYMFAEDTGGGDVVLTNTILEANAIAVYVNSAVATGALIFNNCWFEVNGNKYENGDQIYGIETWSGETKIIKDYLQRTWIIEGKQILLEVTKCKFGDMNLLATDTELKINECTVETNPGWGGGSIDVLEDTSVVILDSPITAGPTANTKNVFTVGHVRHRNYETVESLANTRSIKLFPKFVRGTTFNDNYFQYGVPCNVQTDCLAGSFGITGVLVNDGLLYPKSIESTKLAFEKGQYTKLASTDKTHPVGWHVATLAYKIMSGSLASLNFRNSSGIQLFATDVLEADDSWHTIGGVAYAANEETFRLDFLGNGVDVVWRVSSVQYLVFPTKAAAYHFLTENLYIESSGV